MKPQLSFLAATSAVTIALGISSATAQTHTWNFDFTTEPAGWTPQFVDLPADWQTNPRQPEFTLIAEYRPLPDPLGAGSGYFLAGSNYSDDLFIYIYRGVDGLEPDTLYNLRFAVEYAADEDQSTPGIGGSPGGSVWIKAAGSPEEPERVVEDGYYRTSVDVAHQAGDGRQGGVVGTYGYTEPPETGNWKLLRRELDERRFSARANEQGELWLLVGMDSGFEGTSEVFLTRFEVEATSGAWAAADRVLASGWIRIPPLGWLHVEDLQADWGYHPEHGWLYSVANPDLREWFWSAGLGWTWIPADLYPWLYSTERGWLHFIERSGDERIFERSDGEQVTVPLL